MFRFSPVDDNPHLLPQLRQLYENAFPLSERRTWSDFVKLLPQKQMNSWVILVDEELCGLLIWWSLDNWRFMEYLAINERLRGRGLGSAVITQIVGNWQNIVLEVELPVDVQSKRRLDFYTRLGFTIAPFYYEQPPYRQGEQPLPMHLLTYPAISDHKSFVLLKEEIRSLVYERFRTG